MTTLTTDATVAGYGSRQFAYSANHPDSPLAMAWDVIGPVLVTDNLRADIAHAVSATMLRKAYALGICSVDHGSPADVHQRYSGLFLNESNPADYLVRWIETGCQWQDGTKRDAMDRRADLEREEPEPEEHLDELDRWTRDLMAGDSVPAWFVEWSMNLVYAPKFEYLMRLGAHAWLGAHEPRRPDAEWARKMDKQWARRSAKCERT